MKGFYDEGCSTSFSSLKILKKKKKVTSLNDLQMQAFNMGRRFLRLPGCENQI